MPLSRVWGAPGFNGWVSVIEKRTWPVPSLRPLSETTIGTRGAAVADQLEARRAASRRAETRSSQMQSSVHVKRTVRGAARERSLGGEAHLRRRHVEPEPLAARDRAAARAPERVVHGVDARLRRPVRVVDARLPVREAGLVLGVEDEDPRHVRLAERELERLRVVRALGDLVDGLRRRRLGARVRASPCPPGSSTRRRTRRRGPAAASRPAVSCRTRSRASASAGRSRRGRSWSSWGGGCPATGPTCRRTDGTRARP